MAKIKIVIDNSSDIPRDTAEKYGIDVISLLSIFGDKTYVPNVNMTNAEFYEMLGNSPTVPTTSQTPYAELYDYFLKAARENDTVIYFTVSAKASGQYSTMRLVRGEISEENPNADIRVVDSETFSLCIAKAAIEAREAADAGADADEAIAVFKSCVKRWRCYFIVSDLEQLKKGGRVSKTAAFVGGMLDIKPVLTIENGLVESIDTVRGSKRLAAKLINKIKDNGDYDSENPEFMVVHSDADAGETLRAELETEFGGGCVRMYSEFGPIVGTNVGRGAFAVISKLKKY
ncbi:MAG: DegV family protein [Firmicutes bacterium]|nr:DegV family protein [Bacillota bacterium]